MRKNRPPPSLPSVLRRRKPTLPLSSLHPRASGRRPLCPSLISCPAAPLVSKPSTASGGTSSLAPPTMAGSLASVWLRITSATHRAMHKMTRQPCVRTGSWVDCSARRASRAWKERTTYLGTIRDRVATRSIRMRARKILDIRTMIRLGTRRSVRGESLARWNVEALLR